MSDINYLLHESSVGYAIFEVVHQGDTVGNRLKEVQDATQDLAKFGKMVKLVNFAPYRYAANINGARVRTNTISQRSCRSS
jgi:nucleolar protein 56